jgi:hypothetical protein
MRNVTGTALFFIVGVICITVYNCFEVYVKHSCGG